MKTNAKLLATGGILALALFGSGAARAAGTQAGTVITNTASVSYQVSGVTQTAVTASNSVTVDRKVNVVVAKVGSSAVQVVPNQIGAVTTFTVTNLSNTVLDFALAGAQQAGGAAAYGGTDGFDTTNVKVYLDSNGNGTYEVGTDALVTYLDELAADGSRTVFVVSDIPADRLNGDIATVILTATGREGAGAGSMGAALVQTSGANTNGIDTVFADTAGATDLANDAAHSARNDYAVVAATLTVTKTSKVVSDPLNGTNNPKAIPGATLEYCIAVANAAGSGSATSVAISDPLPAQITYDATYGIFLNGSVTSGACNADGAPGGGYATGTVTGTLSSVAASETKTLRYRATIN